jgi:hypothetical protein
MARRPRAHPSAIWLLLYPRKVIPLGRSTGSAKADPGIEQRVGDVYENVGHYDEHGGGEREPDDHRKVALVDRLDRILADAAEAVSACQTPKTSTVRQPCRDRASREAMTPVAPRRPIQAGAPGCGPESYCPKS